MLAVAVAEGLIVITGGGDGALRLWEVSTGSLLHEVGDVKALATNIARLLDDRELARQLAVRAGETVCPRFAMPLFRQRLLDLIDDAAGS